MLLTSQFCLDGLESFCLCVCVSYLLTHFITISLSLSASFCLEMLAAGRIRLLSLDLFHQKRERTLPTYPGRKTPGSVSDMSPVWNLMTIPDF